MPGMTQWEGTEAQRREERQKVRKAQRHRGQSLCCHSCERRNPGSVSIPGFLLSRNSGFLLPAPCFRRDKFSEDKFSRNDTLLDSRLRRYDILNTLDSWSGPGMTRRGAPPARTKSRIDGRNRIRLWIPGQARNDTFRTGTKEERHNGDL